MKAKIANWLSILLVLETGLIHIFNAQSEYEEAAYMGYLFAANFLAAILAAYGIYRQHKWGWYLGFGVTAASISGYVWSRTAGMPGMDIEEWSSLWGITALTVEALFIGLFFLRPWIRPASDQELALKHPWLKNLAAGLMAVVLILINGNISMLEQGPGETAWMPGMSLEALKSAAWISEDELSQKYGIEVSRVAMTAMNSIVDVRLKVIDPDKAFVLLKNHPGLLVERAILVEAPNMHRHNKLKMGQIFVVFFPTQNHTIAAGTKVSLVFGDVLLQPQTVK